VVADIYKPTSRKGKTVSDFGPYAIAVGWLRKILLYLSKIFVLLVQYLYDY
jgi:hypothetical protein